MAYNTTNTYQYAKQIFETLGVKEDIVINISVEYKAIFRKHLSEIVRRQQSANRYTTRQISENSMMVVRIK